ncbi:MAG TPA: hypothetical protein VIS96_01235 [Terrimicrobiaceae bacterium]
MIIGRYAIEFTKPKVFEEAVNFKGAVEDGDNLARLSLLAAIDNRK